MLPDARQPADRARRERSDVQRRLDDAHRQPGDQRVAGSRTSERTASTATSRTWASTPRNWNTSGWINDLEYVGLNGRDQFDIGSLNEYSDFDDRSGRGAWRRRQPELHAPGRVHLRHRRRRAHLQDRLHLQPRDGHAAADRRQRQRHVHVPHNLPFNPANAFTLSVAVLDRARGHRGRLGRRLDERVRPGPVAGDAEADAEPGSALRLPGR